MAVTTDMAAVTGIAAKNDCFACRRPQTRAYGLGFLLIRMLADEPRSCPTNLADPVLSRAGIIG